MIGMKRFLVIASCAFLFLCCPCLCRAQDSSEAEDLTLASGKRVTPSLRVVLPSYLGAAVPVDIPLGQKTAFSFGIEAIGMRLSAKSSPVEANLGLRWSGMCFGAGQNAFYLGVPARVACKFGRRSKAYAGVAAQMRIAGAQELARFVGEVEGGVSFYGFGLRAAYTVTPFSGGSRAVSLGLIVGL